MPFLQPTQSSIPANQGNTLLEYTLVGGLVVLVCIGGFSLIGTNWSEHMQGLKKDMLSHTQAAARAQAKQAQQIALQANVSEVAGNGATVAANSEGNSTIQTVGVNGTTAAYAADILAHAKQGLDSGKLTQDEYDVVVKLANKGHDIGIIQGLLESAFIQSHGNSAAYANSHLTFNGQNYTPAQLNNVLESNISDFGALRSQASVQNGVLYDAALLSSINDSGGKIINNAYSSQQQNQTADSFIQYQSEGLGSVSADTHQQSATICTTGEHLDANNHCVP